MALQILCPVDGSDAALHAIDCAIDLAKLTGAPITFLAIEVVPADRFPRAPFWNRRHLSANEAREAPPLHGAARKATARAVPQFQCSIAAGSHVGRAIVAYAEALDCDHIVMGTHVTSDWQYLLAGSVAMHVVQHARCPVTVVH